MAPSDSMLHITCKSSAPSDHFLYRRTQRRGSPDQYDGQGVGTAERALGDVIRGRPPYGSGARSDNLWYGYNT